MGGFVIFLVVTVGIVLAAVAAYRVGYLKGREDEQSRCVRIVIEQGMAGIARDIGRG